MEALNNLVEYYTSGSDDSSFNENARFLYVYNSTTLIASVGAIVGLILLGSLLWIAISAALHSEFKGYGNSYGSGGGYRKRRFIADEEEEREYTFMELLGMLDETFRRFNVSTADCQKRAICEAHIPQAEDVVGPAAYEITMIFRKMNPQALKQLEPASAKFFADYFDAADRGSAEENCDAIYSTCRQSFSDHVELSHNAL